MVNQFQSVWKEAQIYESIREDGKNDVSFKAYLLFGDLSIFD